MVPLHNHTIYSALDGCATPSEYFNICAERGYPAVAMTEHGNMASVPDAYLASKDTNVKYIVGIEAYYNDHELRRREIEKSGVSMRSLSDEDKSKYLRHRHLTILCKNMTGYRNLLKLRSVASECRFYRKARVALDLLNQYKDGLIILSGCANGPLSFDIMRYIKATKRGLESDGLQAANDLARRFKGVFGDDYYIELQMPGIEDDIDLFRHLVMIARSLDIKTVITNDAHYISESGYELQRLMMAVDQNTTIDDDNLFISDSSSGYFKTRGQLRDTFRQAYENDAIGLDTFEQSCDNTIEIADKCEVFKPNTDLKLPHIDNADAVLIGLVARALKEKNLGGEYIERAKFELDRINEKEFAPYFLICREIVRQSTEVLGMPVGPRGSAGGSLVCYLIGIHSIDPIKFKLDFNRFLSSSRGGRMLTVNMQEDEIIK